MEKCKICDYTCNEELTKQVHLANHFLKGIEDQLSLINKFTQASIAAIKAAG